jgi:antitoxin ParD1/3/4
MASSYTLGSHFESFVKSLVESGRYSTASEVMRDGLRLLQEREEFQAAKLQALREAVEEGVRSGSGMSADEVFGELKSRYGGEVNPISTPIPTD